MKKALFLLAILSLLLFNFVSAMEIEDVELDGMVVKEVQNNYIREFARDNVVDVTVEVESDFEVKNAQIEVEIAGLEHDLEKASDETDVFDMKSDVRYVKDLQIELSKRMQKDKTYRLRVRLEDQSNEGDYKDYMIYVDSDFRVVEIKDIIMSPENEVVTGQALLVQPWLKNYGQRDESDVLVNVRIPELGISGSSIVDDIEEEESVLGAPIFLKLPDCVDEGLYDLDVVVKYDDGDEEVSKSTSVNVVNAVSCMNIQDKNQTQSQFVTEYNSDGPVVEQKEDSVFSKIIFQYSLMGFALLVILLVIFVIVKQARKEAMEDEEFLKELEEQNK